MQEVGGDTYTVPSPRHSPVNASSVFRHISIHWFGIVFIAMTTGIMGLVALIYLIISQFDTDPATREGIPTLAGAFSLIYIAYMLTKTAKKELDYVMQTLDHKMGLYAHFSDEER